MLKVKSREYIEGHRLHIAFSNGESGLVDLTDSLWGPVFEPLREVGLFRQVTVSPVLHTLHWPNDADFAPEFLYRKILEQAGTPGTLAVRKKPPGD